MKQCGIKYNGFLSDGELERLPGMPSPQRLEKGPVACVECGQQIPCNPCEEACPRHAITVGAEITSLPTLNEELCNGCGLCMTRCPGLAIFKVHKNYSEAASLVGFPYEYYPLPQKGEKVPCGGRNGEFLVEGIVHSVQLHQSFDKTAVVTVEIPKEYCMSVRTIYKKGAGSNGQ